MITRDIVKRYLLPNASDTQQKLFGRFFVIVIVALALLVAATATDALVLLGGLAVAYGFQMWPALIAICFWPWLTRAGITLGLIAGLIAVTCTESIGQSLGISEWGRWPLTIHSAGWGIFFNLIAASAISFITQETKETKNKRKFHDFIIENKNYSLTRRSLKPSAWIIFVGWAFFAFGPGLLIGNELFGKPLNVESWSFGMPSIWVWKITFWILGVLLIWFLAIKMEMSTSSGKTIISQTEDIANTHR